MSNNHAIDKLRKHGKSFFFASLFLSERQRHLAARLYSFCRWLDDIADDTPDKDVARARLFEIKQALWEGRADCPQLDDFLELQSELGIPVHYPMHLVDGLLSDLEQVALKDNEALIRYAYRVAGVVGLMMCPVLGADEKGKPHAIDLGIAMQLTNIARDVLEDAHMGRRYLPGTLCHYSAQQIAKAPLYVREHVKEAIYRILELAETYYISGQKGLVYLPARSRTAIAVAANVYREIGVKLKQNQCQYWLGRTHISLPQKSVVACKTLFSIPASANQSGHNQVLHQPIKGLVMLERVK